MAHIRLISGCMFSGKTTALIQAVREAMKRGTAVAVFKHTVDHRNGACTVSTHAHNSIQACAVENSRSILDAVKGADLVAIDEAHFFDDGLPDVCRALRDAGYDVVITTLDRTWKGREFPVVSKLAEMADRKERMLAVCARCGRPAGFSQRIAPFKAPGDFVGGTESYEPRCADCFVPGVDAPRDL